MVDRAGILDSQVAGPDGTEAGAASCVNIKNRLLSLSAKSVGVFFISADAFFSRKPSRRNFPSAGLIAPRVGFIMGAATLEISDGVLWPLRRNEPTARE